jgi:hypothetical protein
LFSLILFTVRPTATHFCILQHPISFRPPPHGPDSYFLVDRCADLK